MIDSARNAMMAQGADPVTATQRAYGLVFGVVERQAAMQSYLDAFFLLSIMFISMLPLVFLMKRPTKQGKGGEAVAAH